MSYTTAAQDAKTIRETLKREHGWNMRKVSVRASEFSMGSSIDVKIKSGDVDETKVREVAYRAQRIDRCELTGDILAGCNRYVHVSYTKDAEAEMAAPFRAAAENALVELETLSEGGLAKIDGTDLHLGKGNGFEMVQIWGEDGPWHLIGKQYVDAIAFEIARMVRNGNRIVRG